MGPRRTFRNGVAQFFGGPTFDPINRTYTGGTLTASGLGEARAYFPKRMPDTDYYIGMAAGRDMGAVMIVHLPNEGPEARKGMGGATAGIKEDPFQVQLHVYHLATVPHAEDAQADLDDLLDAIKAKIHGDRTLGGICTQAGERPETRIRTRMDPPVVHGPKGAPERVESFGLVTFGADLYITA